MTGSARKSLSSFQPASNSNKRLCPGVPVPLGFIDALALEGGWEAWSCLDIVLGERMSRSQDALDPWGNAKWKAGTSAKETTQLLGGGCGRPGRKQPPNRVHHLDSQIKGEAGRPQGNPASFCRQSEKGGVAGREGWTGEGPLLLLLASYRVPLCFFHSKKGALRCWGKGRESVLPGWGVGGKSG